MTLTCWIKVYFSVSENPVNLEQELTYLIDIFYNYVLASTVYLKVNV